MKGAAVAGLLVVAIVVGAGVGYLFGPSVSHQAVSVSTTTLLFYTVTSTTTTSLTHTSTLTYTTRVNTTQTPSYSSSSPVALMVTSHHLLLQLSLANSSISQGRNITVGLRLSNLLSVANNIPQGFSWAVSGLYWPGNPCSPSGAYEPLGIAIFNGFFSAVNVSSGKPLYLWQPAPYYCPAGYNSPWVFLPMSDVVQTLGGTGRLDKNFTTNGYWNALSQFVVFSPRIYTLVEGDEWGDLVFLYFTVS